MDIGWKEIWELFHFALLSAVVAGAVCPLVGCFLLVRRTGFYGVTLPQFAACGVAFGYAILPWWIDHIGLLDLTLEEAIASPHALMTYHLAWASLLTLGGLLVLVLLGRRKEMETGRIAAAFAIASAATVLLALRAPMGKEYIEGLLRGEILTVGVHEFETLVGIYGAVSIAFVVFHRDLLITSFDREVSIVLRKPVRRFEALLNLLTGLTVAAGALVLGPVVLFGLLVLPPLAARGMARSMMSFYWIAVALGTSSAAAGIYVSYRFDWPLGPAVVAAAAAWQVPGWIAGRRRG